MEQQNVLLRSALDTNPSAIEIPSLAPPLPSSGSLYIPQIASPAIYTSNKSAQLFNSHSNNVLPDKSSEISYNQPQLVYHPVVTGPRFETAHGKYHSPFYDNLNSEPIMSTTNPTPAVTAAIASSEASGNISTSPPSSTENILLAASSSPPATSFYNNTLLQFALVPQPSIQISPNVKVGHNITNETFGLKSPEAHPAKCTGTNESLTQYSPSLDSPAHTLERECSYPTQNECSSNDAPQTNVPAAKSYNVPDLKEIVQNSLAFSTNSNPDSIVPVSCDSNVFSDGQSSCAISSDFKSDSATLNTQTGNFNVDTISKEKFNLLTTCKESISMHEEDLHSQPDNSVIDNSVQDSCVVSSNKTLSVSSETSTVKSEIVTVDGCNASHPISLGTSLTSNTPSLSHPTSLSICIPHPNSIASISPLVSPTTNHLQHSMMVPQRPVLCYTRILLGEITPLLAAMRQATPRWSQHHTDVSQDPLVLKLRELQSLITGHAMKSSIRGDSAPPPAPAVFLDPFLAIIRAEDTTGPVTKAALASVNRILCYGLISPESPGAAAAVENIANAVTHARFVGTDHGADEVVLWEILTVLKTLLLSPVGHLLTNESVCDLLSSSFRICFETRLSELLKNCTADALRHMVALLFARIPQFADDPNPHNGKKLKMKAGTGGSDMSRTGRRLKTSKLLQRSSSPSHYNISGGTTPATSTKASVSKSKASFNDAAQDNNTLPSPSHDVESKGLIKSDAEAKEDDKAAADSKEHQQNADSSSVDSGVTTDPSLGSVSDLSNTTNAVTSGFSAADSLSSPTSDGVPSNLPSPTGEAPASPTPAIEDTLPTQSSTESTDQPENIQPDAVDAKKAADGFVNTQGVKFTHDSGNALVPYGLACIKEVLRFLISLTSPTKDQNAPSMIATSLGLITVALEVGGEYVNKCPSLMQLIKDDLCRNLLLLLKPETKPSILMASLRMCILIFESLRTHVKFQLEMFMTKLTAIITSESPNVSYSHKELALETVVQLWQIPGLIIELFVNFDCDLYSDNIFEDLTKILSKNAFPVQGLYSTNLLSLEALLTVVNILDSHCLSQQKPKLERSADSIDEQSSAAPSVALPPVSGYLLAIGMVNGFTPVTPELQPYTVLSDNEHLLREHLLALKEKKKLLATGTDQFNVKPEKGIQFLQDNGILGTTNEDIAVFMKENPKLDKKMIGEYISKKKNVGILSAFVHSFEFAGLRIDQCLRSFLETFRLPGEAPLISIIIEHFSSHWHKSNNEPFGKEDAAFTLAYAVIMLNVDQHNQNAKKQNIPMTVDQFRNNLRGVNDGKDFDPEMLQEIYTAIATEEIIMPAEQTGLVKENYLWKTLLKRGATKDGKYMLANDDHSFDRDIFSICWGPTVASLSYVFDKSTDEAFIQKSLSGFKKCASISARYGMSDVFDNLVVSLCKFTGLTSTVSSGDLIAIEFGSNAKAQLAAKALFRLVTQHGDILRDGWKNVVEVLLQLFKCRLLPDNLTQSSDLIEGSVSLYKPNSTSQPRVEPSLLSSLYSYIALGDAGSKGTSPEDEQCRERAKKCITDCHIEKLIRESAFLRQEALSDMLKALMTIGDGSCLVAGSATASSSHDAADTLDEYGHALLLEIVIQVIIANKDRALAVWAKVHNYLLTLLMSTAQYNRDGDSSKDAPLSPEGVWLLGRCVAALMRMAGVLGRRPDMSSLVLQSLRMLLILPPAVMVTVSLQICAGVHEVLTLTADHITHAEDWAVVFALLECAGAGAKPSPAMALQPLPPVAATNQLQMRPIPDSDLASSSGPDSGHCSGAEGRAVTSGAEDSNKSASGEAEVKTGPAAAASPESGGTTPGGWIMIAREGEMPTPRHNEWDIVQQREFSSVPPCIDAVVRSVDTLAFLVRERHMTCTSLPCAVQTVRTFVEATLHGGRAEMQQRSRDAASNLSQKAPQKKKIGGRKREDRNGGGSSSGGGKVKRAGGVKGGGRGGAGGSGNNAYDADESDSDDVPATYQQLSEKLLDLLDTLHTSAGSVMAGNEQHNNGSSSSSSDSCPPPSSSEVGPANSLADDTNEVVPPLDWSSGSGLWQEVLCPLLQGIARYCCDSRPRLRHLAMTCLQRALLNQDLHTLDAAQWESCFNKVLFPLLAALVPPLPAVPQGGSSSTASEESRLRAATLVQKVYLRHLNTLLILPTFTALWLTILDYLDKYLSINTTDHLCDAIPEILKNMLLVMETTQVFHTAHGFTRLWSVTWDRIDSFLPGFRTELFKSHPPSKIHSAALQDPADTTAAAAQDGPACTEPAPQSLTAPGEARVEAPTVVAAPTDSNSLEDQSDPPPPTYSEAPPMTTPSASSPPASPTQECEPPTLSATVLPDSDHLYY